jgi:hypothetical protein
VNGRKYAGKSPIVYINGVWNRRDMAIDSGAQIADYYKRPVDVMWNPTFGPILGRLGDVAQVMAVNKLNVPDATTLMVVSSLRDHIKALKNGETLPVIAHSQGGAILSAAAAFLTRAERGRLDVTTYGGAAYTYPDGFHSVQHVVNGIDPVPFLAGKGFTLEKANMYVFFEDILAINHPVADYLTDQKYRDWLASPAGAPTRQRLEGERKAMIEKNWSKR